MDASWSFTGPKKWNKCHPLFKSCYAHRRPKRDSLGWLKRWKALYFQIAVSEFAVYSHMKAGKLKCNLSPYITKKQLTLVLNHWVLYYEFSAASFKANLLRETWPWLVVLDPGNVSHLGEHTLAARRTGLEFALAHFAVGYPVESLAAVLLQHRRLLKEGHISVVGLWNESFSSCADPYEWCLE